MVTAVKWTENLLTDDEFNAAGKNRILKSAKLAYFRLSRFFQSPDVAKSLYGIGKIAYIYHVIIIKPK